MAQRAGGREDQFSGDSQGDDAGTKKVNTVHHATHHIYKCVVLRGDPGRTRYGTATNGHATIFSAWRAARAARADSETSEFRVGQTVSAAAQSRGCTGSQQVSNDHATNGTT